MAETHEVAQGEHLSMIASLYGFPDYTTIWNHPSNAQLKQQRCNPNVLLPGDSLFIPDKEQKMETGGTGKRHTFTVNIKRLMLNFVLEDQYEKPIANASVTLCLDQQTINTTTDAKGKIQHEITPDVQSCMLMLNTDQTPFQQESLMLKIGHLDPVDTLSGQQARLHNLGYEPGTSTDPKDPVFLSAVEEFQCEHTLTADGQAGPKTQAKLLEAHGS